MTIETIIAAFIVFCLFIAGALYAVNRFYHWAKDLFDFECPCDGDDEIYITESEEAAKVRKHQTIRMIEKKKAAEKFYCGENLAGKLCLHNRITVNSDGDFMCDVCKKVDPAVIMVAGGGRG